MIIHLFLTSRARWRAKWGNLCRRAKKKEGGGESQGQCPCPYGLHGSCSRLCPSPCSCLSSRCFSTEHHGGAQRLICLCLKQRLHSSLPAHVLAQTSFPTFLDQPQILLLIPFPLQPGTETKPSLPVVSINPYLPLLSPFHCLSLPFIPDCLSLHFYCFLSGNSTDTRCLPGRI